MSILFKNKKAVASLVLMVLFLGLHEFACEGVDDTRLMRDPGYHWGDLISKKRDFLYFPDKAVELFGVSPGDTVADINPGPGYFTFRMAKITGPEGRVYAVTLHPAVAPNLVKYMSEKVLDPEENPHNNVTLVRSPGGIGLPANSIDIALLSLTMLFAQDPEHPDFKGPKNSSERQAREIFRKRSEVAVKSIYKALKPGGRLIVLETLNNPLFYTIIEPPDEPVAGYGKRNPFPVKSVEEVEFIKKNYESVGFEFLQSLDIYSNEDYRKKIKEFEEFPFAKTMHPRELDVFASEKLFFVFEKPEKRVSLRGEGYETDNF